MQPSVPPQAIRQLIDSLQRELSLYGYEVIETPLIDSADLFLTRAGDQLLNRLFTFERHGQQLALRPEFTAAAAFRYSHLNVSGTMRWQFSGPVFEDDLDQHHYQRLSVGAELIGMNGPVSDAEVISLAAQGITKQGLQSWKLVIGHMGILRHLLSGFRLDRRTERLLLNHLPALHNPSAGKAFVLEEFDRTLINASLESEQSRSNLNDTHALGLTEISTQQMLNVLLDATQRGMTMGGRTQHDIARRLLQKHQRFTERHQVVAALNLLERWVSINAQAAEAFLEIVDLLPEDDAIGHALVKSWRNGVDLLSSYDIRQDQVVIQPYVARNWDYYTGVVFEIINSEEKQLAGGGRYDELVSLVGKHSVPAVGFAFYVDQMLDCLTSEVEAPTDPLVITVNEHNQQAASRAAFLLRSHNIPVILLSEVAFSHPRSVVVEPGGLIRFNGQTYSNDHTDALIKAILAGHV